MHSCRKSTMAVLTTLRSTPSWTRVKREYQYRSELKSGEITMIACFYLMPGFHFTGKSYPEARAEMAKLMDAFRWFCHQERGQGFFGALVPQIKAPSWPHISSDWPAVWPLMCPNRTHHIIWSGCALSRLSWMGIYSLLPLVRFCCEGFFTIRCLFVVPRT